MDFSLETIRIIFLLIPGVIASMLNDKLVDIEKKTVLEFSISTIVFSFLSYALLELVGKDITLFNYVNNSNAYSFDTSQVLLATCIAIFLAAFYSLAENKYWIVKFFNTIRFSNVNGEVTIFKSLMNKKYIINQHLTVRDISNDIIYEGVLMEFSEINKTYELYLGCVSVYQNSSAKLLYETNRLYINTNLNNVTIEIRELRKEK